MTAIREPAVAGQFYPGDPEELRGTVEFLLEEAELKANAAASAPKALIVPHAGYMYSGPVAAMAYARLSAHRARYRRVVLLGPCHRVAVRGLASSSADVFRTPIGDVPLDKDAIQGIDADLLAIHNDAHRFEHSLEVHLPFLQVALGAFTLVPIVVGRTRPERVSDLLGQLWGGDETLIVVSSDLSHYLGYEQARRFDRDTCGAIENFDSLSIDHDHACGAMPISGLLIAAKQRSMTVTTLDLRNSGDTAGDRHAVVGYGSWEFIEP